MYFFLRYGIVNILLVGWLLYQLFIKKKKWNELSGDALAIVFFVIAWCLIAWWAFR